MTTHDLPPTAGYLRGEHLRIRAGLGPAGPAGGRGAGRRRGRPAPRGADALRARGLLREGAGERETVEALHRYVAATPARLLGVALTDAVGDVRAQNQPGTDTAVPELAAARWPTRTAGRCCSRTLAASERVRSLARSVGPADREASTFG